MANERTTSSFKLSPQTLGYIIVGIIAAVSSGGGTAAYFQSQPQPQPQPGNFITRDEFERRTSQLEKSNERIEAKLDRLIERLNNPTTRR